MRFRGCLCRLCFLSDDEFAAEMCFLDAPRKQLAGLVRLVLLDWRFPVGARLDIYEVTNGGANGQVFETVAPRQVRQRRALMDNMAEKEEPADSDLLDDLLEEGPSSSNPNAAFVGNYSDPVAGLIRALEDPEDIIAQPLEEELEDHEAGEQHEAAEAQEVPEREKQESEVAEPVQEVQQAAGAGDAAGRSQAPPAALNPDVHIRDTGSWHFFSLSTNEPVGRLHHLGADAIKATCKIHRNCSCAISMPSNTSDRFARLRDSLGHGRDPAFADIERDLKVWLATALSCDQQRHSEMSLELRANRWLMKTRNRRATLACLVVAHAQAPTVPTVQQVVGLQYRIVLDLASLGT